MSQPKSCVTEEVDYRVQVCSGCKKNTYQRHFVCEDNWEALCIKCYLNQVMKFARENKFIPQELDAATFIMIYDDPLDLDLWIDSGI